MFSYKASVIAFISGISIIVLLLMAYFGMETFVKFWGAQSDGQVAIPAYNCNESKYGSPYVTVVLDSESYQINISGSECRSGLFEAGKIVKVRKHPFFNRIVTQDSHPEYIFIPMVLFIGGSALVVAFSKSEGPAA